VGSHTAVRAQLAPIALAGLAAIIVRGALAGSLTGPIPDGGVTVAVTLPGFLDWFAVGMGLSVLVAEWEVGRLRGRMPVALGRRPGWCAILALAAFALGVPAQTADMFLPWYGLLTHLALGIGGGLLVLAAVGPPGERGRGRLLRGRVLTWVGTISYGIYLWNRVVIQLISRQPERRGLPGAILLWLAALGGALALGAASWYLIERPLQRALRARERRSDGAGSGGQTRNVDAGVQSVAEGLNPSGVAVDHLA
jgi:peptidoglycan/LPS O-acetylase OafA/YrhL